MGDVKYYMGFLFDFQIDGGLVYLVLVFNLFYFEIVSLVVIGFVCVCLDRFDELSSNKVLLIIIYGDVVVIGQGVVQEILNMLKVCGYEVGGMVCIVINNQVGFIIFNLLDVCFMLYCIDIGKMVQVLIFYVNVDDLEVVVFVICLVFDFCNIFKCDVFIDLVCYCCYGYNEVDELSVIQLLMYQKIKKYLILCKIYVDKLEQEKVVMLEDVIEMVNLYCDVLDVGDCVVVEWCLMNMYFFIWLLYFNYEWDEEYLNKVEMKCLQELVKCISMVLEVVEMQFCVVKIYGDCQVMVVGEKLFDWGGVENFVYVMLVDEGILVCLLGEDFGCGIFFYCYVVIYNQFNGFIYMLL